METVNINKIVQMVKDSLSNKNANMEGLVYLKSSFTITADEKFRKDFELLPSDVYDSARQILYGVVPVDYVEDGGSISMNVHNDFVREEDVHILDLPHPPSDWGDGEIIEDWEYEDCDE